MKITNLKLQNRQQYITKNNTYFSGINHTQNNELDKYKLPRITRHLAEETFAKKLETLGYIDLGEWCQFYSRDKDIQGPWKMHIFADNVKEYQDIANVILPYLRSKNIKHKCLGSQNSIYNQMQTNQAGKAFTIYPSSNREMEEISKGIDYIIRQNNLTKHNSHIQGDRMMGTTGRLFYRYEFCSGNYADIYLDMNSDSIDPKITSKLNDNILWAANKDAVKLYRYGLYEENRGGNRYLASDMSREDDIWFDFDPSNPYSTRKIKIEQTKSKIYPYVPVITYLNPNHEYGSHIMDKETQEWFVYDRTLNQIVRDIAMEKRAKRYFT